MSSPLFLIGAGFNRDAKSEVGPIFGTSYYIGEYEIDVDYPLVTDLKKKCFRNVVTSADISVEELFLRAISERNFEPIKTLYDEIMKADYYIVPRLLPSADKADNIYSHFFMTFNKASFLTFNYDSLVNVFLLKLGRWYPIDGYGVAVDAYSHNYEKADSEKQPSTCFVLHLHGSLCLYSKDFDVTTHSESEINWLEYKEHPDIIFDPDSITSLYPPFTRTPAGLGYIRVEERVIAPVPDKSEGLDAYFIKQVYTRALSLLDQTDTLISIGYSFNPLDKDSYEHLIKHFGAREGRKVLLVGPDTIQLSRRLKKTYSFLDWMPINQTFKEWVQNGYLGVIK